MKIILSAVAIVALLAGPCYAQVNYGQGKTGTWSERVEEGLKIEKEERERKLTRRSRQQATRYQSRR